MIKNIMICVLSLVIISLIFFIFTNHNIDNNNLIFAK